MDLRREDSFREQVTARLVAEAWLSEAQLLAGVLESESLVPVSSPEEGPSTAEPRNSESARASAEW